MESFVVQKNPMRALSVSTQRFAMVCHHRNHGFLVQTVFAERIQQLAYARIGVCDFPVVGLGCESLLVWFRRVVRIVRVVEVYPEKEWSLRNLAEPCRGMFDHDLGAPFDSLVTIRAVAAHVKACVIDVETAVKSRSRAVQGIENER